MKKFALYKQLDSLREYVLVDSEQVHVTLLRRIENGAWTIEMYDTREASVRLESIECETTLAAMYDQIELEGASG